ncbi:putative two-component system response regulator [Thermosyntropha lipolytica DSM 11003]|uniref:Stage 0 sporulation protein A homolog n=1 Tax=Thermosyntropha lipolytica DSM 11003 TaxID=1123382 RepID=A0A1M5LUM3_9FIRM|nr:response regulator [Thermosyntropha lipolytica]SHG68804.1 putative two-component system response regulator [Thermosyntropha lipolytica DSM 11003]
MAKILLVDDNALSCEVMEDVFKAWGHQVYKLFVGTGVYEFALKYKPDIVLLDVMLPGMNGFEVCKKLKEDAHTFPIPVIMLTVLDAVEDRIRAFDVGADAFITKPVNYNELKSMISSFLRRRENCRYFETRRAVVMSFLELIKFHNEDLYNHALKTAYYCEKIALLLNLSREKIEVLLDGAYLHDVGKLVERGKEHPEKGVEILKTLSMLNEIYPFIYSHHERMNGTGFPEKIKRESFTTELKILILVDEYLNLLGKEKDKKRTLDILGQKVKEGAFDENTYNALLQVLEDEEFWENLGIN